MNVQVKGVHYDISEHLRAHIDKKLEKLSLAEAVLNDVTITLSKRHDDYVIDMDLHFNWGLVDHLKVEDEDLYNAIDIMEDKATKKIRREKEKRVDSYHGN